MKCVYNHYEKAVGQLGGNTYHIDLKLACDDPNIYSRVVEAISNAIGYQAPVEQKRPALGFNIAEVADPDDGSELGEDEE